MFASQTPTITEGFCIYIDTICEGPVPAVTNGEAKTLVFETELAAQREIVEHHMTRLQEFLDDQRDFDDAITIEEYIVPVTIHPNGEIVERDRKQIDQCVR